MVHVTKTETRTHGSFELRQLVNSLPHILKIARGAEHWLRHSPGPLTVYSPSMLLTALGLWLFLTHHVLP
jgi:hypothetical protein